MNIINNIINSITKKQSLIFAKFGDGEYASVNYNNGHNCDNDNYSKKKGIELIESIKYITSIKNNNYIGLWGFENGKMNILYNNIKIFWENLCSVPIKFADYHTFIIENNDTFLKQKIELYKTIKNSTLKKIYVCNELMLKSKKLLNIDVLIHVDFNNWYDKDFNTIYQKILDNIDENNPNIIMFSAGMASKILIYKLLQKSPSNIYLDLGSALDQICTKKTSRGWEPEYKTQLIYFKDLLSDDWNDSKYNFIYDEANTRIGIHLR